MSVLETVTGEMGTNDSVWLFDSKAEMTRQRSMLSRAFVTELAI